MGPTGCGQGAMTVLRPASIVVPGRRRFFAAFAVLSLVLTVAGFSLSFFVPLARGVLAVPRVVYVHGTLFLTWVTLLVIQTFLVGRGRLRWHQRIGWIAFALVPSMIASGIGVALWATARDMHEGHEDAALAFLLGLFTDMMTFGLLACVGMLMRRRPETHKRLLVMATVVLLGAALVRLLALVTSTVRPWNIAVTALLVVVVTAYDLRTKHRVHAATLWGGGAVLTNLIAQGPLGRTDLWLDVARRIMAVAIRWRLSR